MGTTVDVSIGSSFNSVPDASPGAQGGVEGLPPAPTPEEAERYVAMSFLSGPALTIAKNMGVSDRERDLRERRNQLRKKKSLERERRMEADANRLANAANIQEAAEDRARLDAQMATNRLKG